MRGNPILMVRPFAARIRPDAPAAKVAPLPGLEGLDEAQVAAVRSAFDAEYYSERYEDIRTSGVDPFEHYMIHGWKEGRSPSAAFSQWYNQESNKGRETDVNPFVSWAIGGQQVVPMAEVASLPGLEGLDEAQVAAVRSAFDAEYYNKRYEDIRRSGIDPFEHYMIHGWKEGRSPSAAFSQWYNQKSNKGRETDVNPFVSWAIGGQQVVPMAEVASLPGLEGLDDSHVLAVRSAFDPEYYSERYEDIRTSGVDPFEHYMIHGWKEGRSPSAEFDVTYYVSKYLPNAEPKPNPLVHYVTNRSSGQFHTNEASFLAQELRVIEDVDKLLHHVSRHRTIFAGDAIKNIVSPMFSAAAYRGRQGLSQEVSDLECFLHYLVRDFSEGIGPGPFFDGIHYVREARRRGIDVPVAPERSYLHWLIHGTAQHISPVKWFDEEMYLSLNPDLRHYHEFAFLHFLRHGIREGRRFHPVIRVLPAHHPLSSSNALVDALVLMSDGSAYQEISANLLFWRSIEMKTIMDRATALEPEIADVEEQDFSAMPPWHDTMYWYWSIIRAQFKDRFDNIVLMPFGKLGGADYVGSVLANTLAQTGRTLILRTDRSDWDRPDWFDDGVTCFDLFRWLEPIDGVSRKRILYELLRSLSPRNVFNVNSYLAFQTFETYGARLQVQTNLFAYYFCADRTLDGRDAGYPVSYFANIISFLKGALFDTEQLAQTIGTRYSLPLELKSRLKVVYTPTLRNGSPVSLASKQVDSQSQRPGPVLMWAGRFDRQKRFDLLIEVARQMPDVVFRCWGAAVLDAPPSIKDVPPNVSINPPFKNYEDLPLDAVDGFIYTSAWDGLPTILIELGALGMPIVASAVGGVPELIDSETGWPVPEDAIVSDYVAAIRDLLGNSNERCRRAEALMKRVSTQHNREAYLEILRDLIAPENGSD